MYGNHKSKKKILWFSNELNFRDKLRAVDVMRRSSNTEEINNLYNKMKSVYRKKLAAAKISKYDNIVNTSSNKSRAVWTIINQELNRKSINKQSNITAEDFNKFFANILHELGKTFAKSDNNGKYLQKMNRSPVNSMFVKPTDEIEVLNCIMKLKASNSRDVYDLNSIIIKYICPLIVKPLAYLINKCIMECVSQMSKNCKGGTCSQKRGY